MHNFDYEAEERRAAIMCQTLITAGVNIIKMVHAIDEYYADRLLPPDSPVTCDEETCACSSSMREDLIAENEALKAEIVNLETANEDLQVTFLHLQSKQNEHLAEIERLKVTIEALGYGGSISRVMTTSYHGGCGPNRCGSGGSGGSGGEYQVAPQGYCSECGQTPDTCICEIGPKPVEPEQRVCFTCGGTKYSPKCPNCPE